MYLGKHTKLDSNSIVNTDTRIAFWFCLYNPDFRKVNSNNIIVSVYNVFITKDIKQTLHILKR